MKVTELQVDVRKLSRMKQKVIRPKYEKSLKRLEEEHEKFQNILKRFPIGDL